MEILITGAIGDFITIESFIPENKVKQIKKIYFATPKANEIIRLLKHLPSWKAETEIIWDDWTSIPYIENKEHLNKLLNKKPNNWDKVIDYSIFTIFNKDLIKNFKGSSFLKNKLTDISQELPEKFIVIAPTTVQRGKHFRKDIDAIEWDNISRYLDQTDQYAVVLGMFEQDYFVLTNKRIINLIGLTSLEESIEIIKKANGYIGIDSFLSVLASQLFDKDRIIIKSLSPHLMHSKKYYYAPHKEFDFIVNSIIPFRHCNITAESPAIYFNENHAWNFCKDIIFQINLDNLISYDDKYFQNYVNLKNTNISRKLNNFRTKISKKYAKTGSILDVGIGSGEFIQKSKNKVYGFDINPNGIYWLKQNDLYLNPYTDDISKIKVFTLWDTLEHMANPCYFLNLIKKNQILIATLPIYDDFVRIGLSKHFKKNEHLYYWTNESFEWYMEKNGFRIVETSEQENKCGRQGVKTFVCKKIKENKIFGFGQIVNR